jgi:hypothetical protein
VNDSSVLNSRHNAKKRRETAQAAASTPFLHKFAIFKAKLLTLIPELQQSEAPPPINTLPFVLHDI